MRFVENRKSFVPRKICCLRYMAYALTEAYSPNFSSPIGFIYICMVWQISHQIFPTYGNIQQLQICRDDTVNSKVYIITPVNLKFLCLSNSYKPLHGSNRTVLIFTLGRSRIIMQLAVFMCIFYIAAQL